MSRKGIKLTEEHKKKISESLKKRWQDPAVIEKHTGKNNGFFGKHPTQEVLQKNIDAHTGKNNANYGHPRDLETKRKISLGNSGKKRSEETKKTISSSVMKLWENSEYRKKMLISLNLRWKDPLECKKQSDRISLLWQDNEYREMMLLSFGTGEQNSAWRGGISFDNYNIEFNSAFKKYIREKFQQTCYICGCTESDSGYLHSVHHVSYDKKISCKNEEWKFIILCQSCHGKTNFNRHFWFNLLINYWLENSEIHLNNMIFFMY